MELIILTLLIVVCVALFTQPIAQRLRIAKSVRHGYTQERRAERWKRFFDEVILQVKVVKERPLTGIMHGFVFFGFVIFALETFSQFAAEYGWHPLGDGGFHQVYRAIVAVISVLVLIGIGYLAFRRFVLRPKALGHLSGTSAIISAFIMLLMITYLLNYSETLQSPLAQRINFWLHAGTILAFLVIIPHSKHIHLVLSPFTIFLKDIELARIRPLDFEKEEMGAEKLTDFSAHTALGAFTCVECGRCMEHCPANQTGKLLDPKKLMLDLRAGFLGDLQQPVVNNVIPEEVIWQCTTCGACTYQCPVGIDQVVPIIEMRRGQVSAAEFPKTMRPLFDNLEKTGNPWKYSPSAADEFLDANGFPDFDKHDVLFWLGCMGRYDFYYQKVSLSVAKLLNAAKIRWGILRDEQCTGDAARRAGNEMVFQSLAEHNIEILNAATPKMILTSCPHCLRTLTEYRDLGLNPAIPIVHHSEYISGLIQSGKLKLNANAHETVVYHDACYLSRYIGKSHAQFPREVIQSTGATIAEPKHREEHTFCCGAGGAMLFTEETVGERVNHHRVKELLETHADNVGTACPFCHLMLRDGLRDMNKESIAVKDIAELAVAALPEKLKASTLTRD
jgi:Fe-S oxidoreductase